jgi:hypothetical protein
LPDPTPLILHQASASPLIPPQSSLPFGYIIPILSNISRAGPDHYVVDYVDDKELITGNVLVQDSKWPGPLVVVEFVAFNATQLVTRCLGRNSVGDVIERFLIFWKSDCFVPHLRLHDAEDDETLTTKGVLVSGLSEREYLPRDSPGPFLPYPHSPLPFPLLYPRPGFLFRYESSYCVDDVFVAKPHSSPWSSLILLVRSCF